MSESLIIQAHRAPLAEDFANFSKAICHDWDRNPVKAAPSYLYWLDDTHFHFFARQNGASGLAHPLGKPNTFQAELWKYDVAEFFLQSADRSRYLEFNLAPNGAWWTCLFQDPLIPAPGQPRPFPGIQTSARQNGDFWETSARFLRGPLEEIFPLDQGVTLNTTFILQSPEQIFLTSGNLGDGKPDFHRPDRFPPVKLVPLA